jgi:hypothetical protein
VLIGSPVSVRHPSTTATASGLLAELSGPTITSPCPAPAAGRKLNHQQLPLLGSVSTRAAVVSSRLEPAGAAVAGSMLAPTDGSMLAASDRASLTHRPASLAGVLNSILASAAGPSSGMRMSQQELQGPLLPQLAAQTPAARPKQQRARAQQHSADPGNSSPPVNSSSPCSSPPAPLLNMAAAAAGPPAAVADLTAGRSKTTSSSSTHSSRSSVSGAMLDAEPLASLSIRDLRDLLGQVAGMSLAQLQGR